MVALDRHAQWTPGQRLEAMQNHLRAMETLQLAMQAGRDAGQ